MTLLAAEQPTIIVPLFEGVTTALVAFIFVCVAFPRIVKNKPQFYAAFFATLAVILLHTLAVMVGGAGFQVFAGVMTGLLQILAIILLVLCAGGVTMSELANDMAGAYEVIRRGEEGKTLIVPLTGEMPRRDRPMAGGSAKGEAAEPQIHSIDLPPGAGWPATKQQGVPAPPPSPKASPNEGIPLE